MAMRLDKFDLYTLCVQDPPRMAEFLGAVHGGAARTLRDDFAGPGAIARAWVAMSRHRRAVAIDLDPVPLKKLGRSASVKGLVADVRKAKAKADIICALNFGVCELHTRRDLLAYLKQARASLETKGVLVCDLYGGTDSFTRSTSSKRIRIDRSTIGRYRWVQEGGDVATGRVRNRIDFTMQAGSHTTRFPSAFTYDWRLWSIPELSDAMMDAGFASVEIHDRMGGARDAEGNLHVRPLQPGEPLDDPFVAYIVARK